MRRIYETTPQQERAILVTVKLLNKKDTGWSVEDSAKELKELAKSSTVKIVEELICKREKPTADLFIGQGKGEEIHQLVHEHNEEVEAIIFSENLTFTQQRNLEELIGVKVIDRAQLILDIFAQRAHSEDGKLQVELAQLEYLRPRLTGRGIMLSRLGGGIGTRGPGEQKLEVDRRRIDKRIAKIKNDLASLGQRREQRRKFRKEHSIVTVAIVGYTNAGKSTLINAFTKSNIFVDDKLFSTLDTTSRRYILPNHQKVLFIDTVGFLHNLPLNLIEAFKATLEEVIQADLLLEVVDVSNEKVNEIMDSVYGILRQLGAEKKPIITALNKKDLVNDKYTINRIQKNIPDCAPISALKRENLDALAQMIMEKLSRRFANIDILIPHTNMNIVNMIYNEGHVTSRKDTPSGVHIKASVPVQLKEKLKSY